MTEGENYDPFDRMVVGGVFLAFVFGPGIVFAIGGDTLAATIATLATVGVVMMVESGLYDGLKVAVFGGESDR